MSARSLILAAVTIIAITPSLRGETSNVIHRASPPPATTPSVTAPVGSFDTSRVLLSLGAVVGLIFLLRWSAKRLGAGGTLGARSGAIQVLARSYIAPKHQIMIVQIGRRVLVIGDGGQQLSTLCEITDPDEAAALVAQLRGGSNESAASAIANAFRGIARRPAAPDQTAPPAADDSQLVNAREELNGLAEKVRVVARHLSGTS